MNRLLLTVVLLAVSLAEGAKLNGGRSFGRSSGGRGRGRDIGAAPADSYSAPPAAGPTGPQGDAGYGGANLRAEASNAFGVGAEEDPVAALEANIPGGGIPGEDYPILSSVPDTGFLCEDQEFPGYYADIADEAGCQVFHICQEDFRQDSFLCPNGTIFNQQYFVCDWWFNVDCAASEDFFGLNGDIGKTEEGDLRDAASNANYDYTPPANGNGNNGYGNGAPAAPPSNGYDAPAAPPSDSYGAPEAPQDSYGAPPADVPEAPGQLYDTPAAGGGRSLGGGRRRNNGGRRNRGRSFSG